MYPATRPTNFRLLIIMLSQFYLLLSLYEQGTNSNFLAEK
jgi:hypothetical protein